MSPKYTAEFNLKEFPNVDQIYFFEVRIRLIYENGVSSIIFLTFIP
jgi:hypothetical protein